MNWKTAGGLVLLLLLLLLTWAGASFSDNPSLGRDYLRERYRRPVAIPFPADNPFSAAKLELGRTLFFDPILSGPGSHSCGSCHQPTLAWGDGRPRAVGVAQAPLALRSPTLLAVAWMPLLGWDGKFRDLESVAFTPITAAANMNLPEDALIERLSSIPGYLDAFTAAFGERGVTRRKIELALATFERSIVPGEAPFDRWIAGDETAIEAAAKRGFVIFNGKARCSACHSGHPLSDGSFHDIGTAEGSDIGRGRLFPTSMKLRYAFKTPTLRDVARRAPYMHDGSVATLEAVIDLYDRGGVARPSRSPLIAPLGLTQGEKQDLIAFLHTLTSDPDRVALPALPR
jgi:cytochrome c peroxidase